MNGPNKTIAASGDRQGWHQAVLQSTMDGYWMADAQGRLLEVNESYCRMSGYSQQELLGMKIGDLETVETADQTAARIHKIMKHGNDRFESLHRRRDGTVFPVEISAQYLQAEDGRCVVFVRDITDRKRLEKNLLDQRRRLESIIEGERVGTWEWNVQTGATVFNETWARIIGYRLEELAPTSIQTWSRFVHPDDLRESNRLLERHFVGELPYYEYECRMRHREGHWVWVNDRGRVLSRTEDGKPLMMFGTHADVTERKRSELILKDREERIREVLENSLDASYKRNLKTNVYDYFSPVIKRISGYTAEEMKSMPLETALGLVHPDDRDEVKRLMTIALSEDAGSVHQVQYRFQHKDGRYRWLLDQFSVVRDERGLSAALIGSVSDITERKLADEALKESLAQHRQLFEMGSDALFLIDPETGKILDANVAAAELYGYRLEEMRARHSWDMSAEPEDTSRLTGEMPDPPETITRIPLRYHRKKDGTVFPVEISARSFPLQGKQALIVSARDISERMENEKQLRRLQKAESMQRMAGAIAHHFNNQLGTVMGNLDLAKIQLPRGAQANDCLDGAMQAARRAAKVSSLLLTYLGQTRDDPAPIDLQEVCRLNIPLIQAIKSSNIVFETSLPASGPTVNATSSHIQLVLTALLTNAAEAIPEGGGRIHLTVNSASAKEIPATNRYPLDWQPQDASYGCLEISDTGCGISSEGFEKLFDPFYSTKSVGRGLGLPAVLGIARADGGGITVQSEPGRGSVFRVYFRLAKEPALEPPGTAPDLQEPLAGGTVLLVEDDETLRKTTASMLSLLGFSVIASIDGVEAIEIFRQRRSEIRLVVCDLTMPRLNGIKTVATLKEIAGDIPTILTSGHHEAIANAGSLPGEFLGKPYGFAELRAAVIDALAKKK